MLSAATPRPSRWEIYRLLGEPVRLRLLALAAEEELMVGELAVLLGESQPSVSRHVAYLKRGGLLSVRKQGTRVLVRIAPRTREDRVILDGIETGQELTRTDGSLARVGDIVRNREAAGREFFEQARPTEIDRLPTELPAYLTALAALIHPHALAVDAGTGEGAVLDLLAPIFDRVIAIDRSPVQLERARERLAKRAYVNVELIQAGYDAHEVRERVWSAGGADVVFASRVIHHAPRPTEAVRALAQLARPGGAVVIIDYAPHSDERMRDEQADAWLGFAPEELEGFAIGAGLCDPCVHRIQTPRTGQGPDGHLEWQSLVARRPLQTEN